MSAPPEVLDAVRQWVRKAESAFCDAVKPAGLRDRIDNLTLLKLSTGDANLRQIAESAIRALQAAPAGPAQ